MAAIELEAGEFESQVLGAEVPVIVDFWADWCGPCKVLKPIVDELADEAEGFKVFSISAEGNDALTSKYNVLSLPCLLFFKDGEVVKKTIGFKSKEHILEIIEAIR